MLQRLNIILNDIKLKNVCSKENIEAIIIEDIED